jgi:recombination protein RecA
MVPARCSAGVIVIVTVVVVAWALLGVRAEVPMSDTTVSPALLVDPDPTPAMPASSASPDSSSPSPSSSPSSSATKPWRRAWRRLEALAGRGAVALFGVAEPPALTRVSTGHAGLDEALRGGLPLGRLVEVAGPAGIGKTSFALSLCAAAQRRGGIAAVIDVDGGLERSTLLRCGVDAEHLVIARPDSGEAALQVVDELLRARAAEVIVLDSVAALVPRAELSLPTGTAPAGHLSRLMSQSVRRLTLQAAKSRAVVVFVNQFRRNWGEDGRGYDVTTGGNALVYAAATRLFLTRGQGDVRVTLQKARFGQEGRSVALTLPPGAGPA